MRHKQIAARLRLALEQEAARHELSAGAWPQIERQAPLKIVAPGRDGPCSALPAAGHGALPVARGFQSRSRPSASRGSACHRWPHLPEPGNHEVVTGYGACGFTASA
jgi:hypothetical protein